MLIKRIFLFVFALVACLSCEDYTSNAIPFKDVGTTLEGKWMLVAYSFSTGGPQQITRQVPVNPPQLIQFHPNHSVTSGMQGFSEYIYYDVSYDSTHRFSSLNLYKQIPATTADEQDIISFGTTALYLHNLRCIEGCSLSFRRLE